MAGPRENPGKESCEPLFSTHKPPPLYQEIRNLYRRLCAVEGKVGRIGAAGPSGPAGEPGPAGPTGPAGAGAGISPRFFHHQVDWKVIGPPIGTGTWESTLFTVERGRAFTFLWIQGICICVNAFDNCPALLSRWRISIGDAVNALTSWPQFCGVPGVEYLYWFDTPGGMGGTFPIYASGESGFKYYGGGVGINPDFPYGVPLLTRITALPDIEIKLKCVAQCPKAAIAPHVSFILQGEYLVTPFDSTQPGGGDQVAEQFTQSCVYPDCPPFPQT